MVRHDDLRVGLVPPEDHVASASPAADIKPRPSQRANDFLGGKSAREAAHAASMATRMVFAPISRGTAIPSSIRHSM